MARIETCEHCGGHTVRISWSSLKTWEECRQKGSLFRAGKKMKQQDVRNMFPGRVTDRVVRYWLEADPRNNLGAMPGMVHGVIEKELGQAKKDGELVNWRSEEDRAEVEAACILAVTNIEPALIKYVLPFEWEVDFGFKTPVMMPAPWGMERVVLNGYMDIIVHNTEDDSWRIYDVKHTLDKHYYRGSFGQLIFYALENQMRTGKLPVEVGFFQPLVENEPVKRFTPTDQHVNALAARIAAMASEIWQGEDTPRSDSAKCGFCEVRHACVKFKPVKAPNGRQQVSLV